MSINSITRRGLLTTAAACLASAAALPAAAQLGAGGTGIRIVVPFAAGGGSDVVARLVADGMREALQEAVIVDNRAGAGGNIGTAAV
jgi:tripartite-type tricarboxylate transporter receptor subunit TctC